MEDMDDNIERKTGNGHGSASPEHQAFVLVLGRTQGHITISWERRSSEIKVKTKLQHDSTKIVRCVSFIIFLFFLVLII